MRKIKLYGHSGSGNHGCEALVRTTVDVLGAEASLYSAHVDQDQKWGLDQIVSLYDDATRPVPRKSARFFLAALNAKLGQGEILFTRYAHPSFFENIQPGDVCLSIGGDTYCYGPGGREILAHYNRIIHQKGGKTVLWGCSIDENVLDKASREDLARYDLITARESFSYELLKKINPNTIKVCDSAFFLKPEEMPWPDNFVHNNVVGINVSPLAQAGGCLVMENYRNMMEYILTQTNMNVALIPHVVTGGEDDMTTLEELYRLYQDNPRVVLLPVGNCMELKGYISKCRFFVGARTHATIAAYSSLVPTLVTGYSLKARGIAEDLFSTWENYVLPVQELKTENELSKAFRWIMDHESQLRSHLAKTVPSYMQQIQPGITALQKLIEE